MVNAGDIGSRSVSGEGFASSTSVGRYRLGPRIAVGGMGTVTFGMMTGAAGFARVVAVKRLHAQYAQDAFFTARFKEEIWLSARILHPNVVQVLDVVEHGEELLFVMEYVHGDTLRSLQLDAAAQKRALPLEIVAGIVVPALHGLHAAHQTRDDLGNPLRIVHRDVSPQNLLIGRDGQVKVLDFGVAKATQHSQATRPGHISGKVAYLSPEQALGRELDARSDVFAAGTVLWETLVGTRLFRSDDVSDTAVLGNVLSMEIPPPSRLRPDIPEALERVVMRALARDRDQRFESASELALAIESAVAPASPFSVGHWFVEVCAERLKQREELLASFRDAGPFELLESTDSAETRLVYEPVTSTQIALTESVTMFPGAAGRAVAKRSRRVAHGFALLALLTALLLVSFAVDRHARRPSDRVVATPAAPAIVARAIPTPSASADAPAGKTLVEPNAAASALREPPATGSVASSARPARPVTTRKPPVSPRTPAAQVAKALCDPPTYVDAVGIRHFKEQCL